MEKEENDVLKNIGRVGAKGDGKSDTRYGGWLWILKTITYAKRWERKTGNRWPKEKRETGRIIGQLSEKNSNEEREGWG
jgi:hypothetical protein